MLRLWPQRLGSVFDGMHPSISHGRLQLVGVGCGRVAPVGGKPRENDMQTWNWNEDLL